MFFFRFTAVVAIFSFLLLLVPGSKVNKVLFIIAGGFCAAVGAFMSGPSQLLGLPNSIDLIGVGMIVSGIGKGLI